MYDSPKNDFQINYGTMYQIGSIVNILSDTKNTFFMDRMSGTDDGYALAYWQAHRSSPYKYSWYVYFAPNHKRYNDAKAEMLKNNPPDFYYTRNIDPNLKAQYQQLKIENKPGSLYVKKSIYAKIPQEKWLAAQHLALTK